ncbi:MAG TPA: glycosyltransferase family 39 protein [Terriglobales bacterium]|nr:glycosyltransferase family 39 protein [Terriglobales bacterium]
MHRSANHHIDPYPADTEITPKWAIRVAIALIVFGVVLRLFGYFADRGFWRDEIAIALNVRFSSFIGLLRPLEYEQTMPIPLLLAVKSLVGVFGPSEYVFRLLFLAGGCTFLVLLWCVFVRLFGWRIALISVALAAIFRPLIYYSSELKQYGFDALITLATLWFGWQAISTPERRGRWRLFVLWGAIALCLAQPVVFVIAALGLAAMVDSKFRQPGWKTRWITGVAVWVAVFAILYFVSYRAVSHSPYMRQFWGSSFLDPGSPNFPERAVNSAYVLLGAAAFDHLRAAVLALLFGIGLYGIFARHGSAGLMIAAGPYVLVLAAAALKQYPIADRLLLFLAPLLFWIYASAAVTVSAWLPHKFRTATALAIPFALFLPTAAGSVGYAVNFPQRESTRDAYAYIKTRDPGGAVYIALANHIQWAYYAADWSHPELVKRQIDTIWYRNPRAEMPVVDRLQIVGTLPPRASLHEDETWAKKEADRIYANGAKSVWLFAPVYTNNPIAGQNFAERRVLEKIQNELANRGAQLVDTYAKGDTVAWQYLLAPSSAE